MRVGVVTTSYPRFVGDPAGTFVRALCLQLVRRGHTCEVIAPDDPAWQPTRDRGVDVHRVEPRLLGVPTAFYGAGVPDNVRRDPRAAISALAFGPRLVREVAARSSDWDAALTHWALPSAVAARLAFGAARHVAVWHSADVQLAQRMLGERAWRALRGVATDHVFVAEHLRRRLGADGDAHAHVVPMGIDLPDEPPVRALVEGRRLRALVLARLVPIKRVELAIAACVAADVELVIAGDGPERARLEASSRHERVRFVGSVDAAARAALFSQSDVLLACSAHDPEGATEGYPVAPREALAHGVVVLATADPVHAELARRCGPAVITTDESALAEALRALVADRARLARLARSARDGVRGDGWDVVGDRIGRLLARSDLDATRARVRRREQRSRIDL